MELVNLTEYLVNELLPNVEGISVKQIESETDTVIQVLVPNEYMSLVIGKGGSMLKKIGQAARKEMEGWLDCPVNLQLFVRVKEDWRNKEGIIRQLNL